MEMALPHWPARSPCLTRCREQRRLWTVWQFCWPRLLHYWGPTPSNLGQAMKRRNRTIISSRMLISRSRFKFAALESARCSAEVRTIGLIRHQEEPTVSVLKLRTTSFPPHFSKLIAANATAAGAKADFCLPMKYKSFRQELSACGNFHLSRL